MKKVCSLLLALAMVLSLLTACGGGSGDAGSSTGSGNSTPSTGSSSATEPSGGDAGTETKDPVKLAIACPVTGDSAEYGKHFTVGAEMAVEMINAEGGINGREVVLEIFDSKNDAKEAAEVARLICQTDDILATVGDFSSTACMATAPIYQENGVVQISPSAGLIDFPQYGDYNFATTGVQSDDGPFLANRVLNETMGVKSYAVVYTNNDFGLNFTQFMNEEAESLGISVTDSEAIASGEQDFTAIVSKMRQTNPEAVVIVATYTEVANCVKQIRQVGWDVPIAISGSSTTAQLVDLLGEDVNGIYSNIAFAASEDDSQEVTDFTEEFTERAGMPPSFHSVCIYDTVHLLCLAARECGDNLTRETLRDALASYTGFSGLMGGIEFTEDGAVHRGSKVTVYKDEVLTAISPYMMAR